MYNQFKYFLKYSLVERDCFLHLAEHLWNREWRQGVSGHYLVEYFDEKGCHPLYGTNKPNIELKTPILVDACYTNPDDCKSGFSVRADIQGTFCNICSHLQRTWGEGGKPKSDVTPPKIF